MNQEQDLSKAIKETGEVINNILKENKKYLFWNSIKSRLGVLGLGAFLYFSVPVIDSLSYANFSIKMAEDPQISKIYQSNSSEAEKIETLERVMEEEGYNEKLSKKSKTSNALNKASKAAGGASLAYFLLGGAVDIRNYRNKNKFKQYI